MQNRTTRQSGFTLLEVLIVAGIIGLLAAIAVPNFVRARTAAQTNTCIANLKEIEAAITQWALEKKKSPRSAVSITDISGTSNSFIKAAINTQLTCPAGGSYTLVTVAVLPTCSLATSGHSL